MTTATVNTRPPLPDTPGELGLDPVRFPAWRPGQPAVIEAIIDWYLDDEQPRVMLLQAPTGTGKSLIAAAVAAYIYRYQPMINSASRGVIVSTITRNLQSQYVNETLDGAQVFREGELADEDVEDGQPVLAPMQIASAWGRAGHQCLIIPGVAADAAPCTAGFRCDRRGECSYYVERDNAHEADLSVLNTAMYLTGLNWVRQPDYLKPRGDEPTNMFDAASLHIADEAHLLERAIRGMIEIRLYPAWFEKAGLPPLPATNDYDDWESYLDRHMDSVRSLANAADREAQLLARRTPPEVTDDDVLRDAGSVFRAFKNLYNELLPTKPLITHEPASARGRRHVLFRPVWGATFAEHLLFRHAYKHLLMSATIPHPAYTAETLGLGEGEYRYLSLPNPFAIGRRRIEYHPVLKMNARTTDVQFLSMIEAMDRIIDLHPEHKGIIHSVSYDRARKILRHSRHNKRMITHDQRRGEKELAIDRHLMNDDPTILVSPSVGVGEDFGRDDGCRFQVFIKYPIPYLGDPVTRARSEEKPDSLWLEADMAFIQSIGRGTRSETDWCLNYVLDKGAAFRLGKLPADIQQAIVRR